MEVELRETFVELPANGRQPPSENPALFGQRSMFPYPQRRQEGGEPHAEQWRAVELENDFLKLVALPDMGGRVAELYDKLAGHGVFLPLSSALRGDAGPSAGGGLSFHFPFAPSPAASEPVNCLTRRYSDGSASIVFGGVERRTFLIWSVELRLYPDKAYLEQSVELLNPTDAYKRYLWRNCAAVPVARGMSMVFPFDWRKVPSGDVEKWPMDGALDSSDPGALPDGYETSGALEAGDCFGAYYPGWDFGAAHYAPRSRVRHAGFAMRGESVQMTCSPTEYEGSLKPHGAVSWNEYWFGVRGIGKFCQASRDAAVAVERYAGGAVVRLSSNASFDDATVIFTHDGQKQESPVALSPDSPSAVEFPGVGAEEKLTVDVVCQGRLLVSLGHESAPCEEPPEFEPDEAQDIPAEWLDDETIGEDEEYGDSPARLTAQGIRYLSQRRHGEAMGCIEQALAEDLGNGEARYLLACAAAGCGDADRASRLFASVPLGSELYEAATLEQAALNLRCGNPYGNEALLEGCESSWSRFLLAVSRRVMGLHRECDDDIGELEEFSLAERYLSLGDSAFSSYTDNCEDQIVPIALHYARLGLPEDCQKLLSLVDKPGMKAALARACCGELPLSEALGMTLGGVFVNEPELLEMLEGCEDETGRAQWLLGCFQYSAGLPGEAMDRWLAAYELGLRHSALLFCMGRAYYERGDLDEAYRYLREDASLHTNANAESLSLLCKVLRERGDIFERLELLPLLQETQDGAAVAAEIVSALKDGGLLEEALEALESSRFPCEASAEAAGLWSGTAGALALKHAREGRTEDARAAAARVFDYPETLVAPGAAPRAEYLHMLGQVYRLTGDLEKSRDAFRQGALEGGVPFVREDYDAMRWVRLCQDELRY